MVQSVNKIQVPTRTKFAVWWVRIIAVLLAIQGAVSFYFSVNEFIKGINSNCDCDDGALCSCLEPMTVADLPLLFFGPVLFIVFSSIIFVASVKTIKGGKISWCVLTGTFFIAGCLLLISSVRALLTDQIVFGQMILLAAYLFIIPAFYLLYDRKNYFAAIERAKNQT